MSDENDEALAMAHVVNRAGLSGVALFALDMLKPLHWLGGQAVWVLQPFAEALGFDSRRDIGGLTSGSMARLLEREGGLDELTAHINDLSNEGAKHDRSV